MMWRRALRKGLGLIAALAGEGVAEDLLVGVGLVVTASAVAPLLLGVRRR